MIKIHVSDWLGKAKMSQKELSRKTGIRPATINAYYHEKIQRIEIDHINAFCHVFNCQPGDLMSYTPSEDEQT